MPLAKESTTYGTMPLKRASKNGPFNCVQKALKPSLFKVFENRIKLNVVLIEVSALHKFLI